ncbi:MAG: fumarylacetoacetate hydrolase family protein [Alphaproteobacteria bacterium]|nr:fumarylacetoacetate hydrolase family protein [Alphaproteobacteria bacterium]
MKLVRFGPVGSEKPGLIDGDGRVRDVSRLVGDFSGEGVGPASLDALRGLELTELPLAGDVVRIGPPVGNVRNFIAVGLNYADHAAEAGLRIPREPVIFNKMGNCIVGPNDNVMRPRDCKKLDWEVEIAFVIGKRARYVDEADAASHIAGYCICNDISERHFQIERSGQWVKGKCAETFGPLGPWLVTGDELDIDNLGMWLDVNGKRKQTGSTANMIFKIPYTLAYISQFMVLEPGDVVTTGTPPGVALGMSEPEWLEPGDIMRLGIDGLGVQEQRVVEFAM